MGNRVARRNKTDKVIVAPDNPIDNDKSIINAKKDIITPDYIDVDQLHSTT